jgi:signal peptidase II
VRALQAARGASLSSEADPGGTPDPAPAAHPVEDRTDLTGTAVRRPSQARLLAVVAALALAADLGSKVLVVARLEAHRPVRLLGGALLLAVSRNSGAAFSFAQGATIVFTAVALLVIVVIARTARRLRSRAWAVSLGLLLGGATGNLVDRLFRAPGPGRGAVVDFLDFRVWPVFNLADSAIVVGGLLAVLLSLRGVEFDGTRTARDREPS